MMTQERSLVNPIALKNCFVRLGDVELRVLDISFIRTVVKTHQGLLEWKDAEPLNIEFCLDRIHFNAMVSVHARGEEWMRLAFDRIVPSARAHLRSFLCPKKIGESIVEDWRRNSIRHYHGLNESELWFDPEGGVLFTYLDQNDFDAHFIIRLLDLKGPLQAGKIPRMSYLELNHWNGELTLSPLNDREIYARLSECRDIITNFRPTGEIEYSLKQRLLKVVSENLYSTSHRVEIPSTVRVSRSVQT